MEYPMLTFFNENVSITFCFQISHPFPVNKQQSPSTLVLFQMGTKSTHCEVLIPTYWSPITKFSYAIAYSWVNYPFLAQSVIKHSSARSCTTTIPATTSHNKQTMAGKCNDNHTKCCFWIQQKASQSCLFNEATNQPLFLLSVSARNLRPKMA